MPRKRKLVWHTEDGSERLGFSDPKWHDDERDAVNPAPTLKQIADMLDHDAEDKNRHDFVGVHRKLMKLLQNRLGSSIFVMDTIRDIAERGVLHGIAME